MMEEVTERKKGDFSLLFLSLKRVSKCMGNSRLSPGIVSLASLSPNDRKGADGFLGASNS
jgi:hypothetical protein